MFDRTILRVREVRKHRALLAQLYRLRKGLRKLLISDEIDEDSLLALLKAEEIDAPKLLSALPRMLARLLRGMTVDGTLSPEDADRQRARIDSICFETLEEDSSPLHSALLEKDFYRTSDSATRRLMRAQLMRFARRHRLSESQACSLWEGEAGGRGALRRVLGKCLAWLPALLTAAALSVGGVLFWDALSFWAIGLCLMLVCPIWEAFTLLTEGAVRLFLPSAPLPVLEREKSPAVCAMLVASAEGDAKHIIRQLEQLIAANREADALFGLVLTLPDSPSRYTSSDSALCEPFLSAFDALEKRCDRPLRLCIAERTYLPREKRWRGVPASDDLVSACTAMLANSDARFAWTVGKRSPKQAPAALYIAPADSILAPDGLRALACTLFHPLCTADCVLPILSTAGERTQARLDDRLKALTKRQVTLQKLDISLPYPSYGMIKLSALESTPPSSLSSALAVSTLFVKAMPNALSIDHPSEEELLLTALPSFRARFGALLRLPLYLALIAAPPAAMFGGLMLSAADLIVEVFLSIRSGQRLRTHTLPQLIRSGKKALRRTVFTAQQCFSALPYVDRLSERMHGVLTSLFAVGVGISTAALFPLPRSMIGLIWALSPLLATLSGEKRRSIALSAAERENLLIWGRKCWTFSEKAVTQAKPLPSGEVGDRLSKPISNETAPDAFTFYLIACLSACDLGWIDPFTLENRLCSALDAWETLPTYHGLPYARYSLETGDPVGQSRIDTALCGQYALALAALAEGLLEHAEQNSALTALSERVRRLWQRMDFTRLYDRAHSAFFEACLPSGEGVGRLDLLMGGAKAACIAALALGQIDYAAWKRLRRPAVGKGIRLGMASKDGTLDEYLLDALFLPSSEESLIGRARSYACRTVGSGDAPFPSGDRSLALMPDDARLNRSSPHTAFLMLPFRPAAAIKCLHHFGTGKVDRMRSSAHIGQSLAALDNALNADVFCRRLMRNASFAALIPLLNEPFDRLESPCPTEPVSSAPPLQLEAHALECDIPTLFLFGDSSWGVLWADGRRVLPFYMGQAMAFGSSVHALYEDGHFSGLLLFDRGRAIPSPATVCRRESGSLTLAYRSESASLLATLTLPEDGLVSLTLCCECIDAPLTALFCYSPIPIPQENCPFRLETMPLGNLLLIHANGWVAALTAEGFDAPFIRAEEAPLPLGTDSLSSLIHREASFTDGSLLTPACRIGGTVKGTNDCRFLLAFGRNRAEVLDKLARAKREETRAREQTSFPLPNEENTALSYALSLELQCLFERHKLRRFLPASSENAPSPNLLHCLEESLKALEALGFEADEVSHPLPPMDDLPTDAFLKALLRAEKRPVLCSPPLPERTRVRLTEGALTIAKGLDLPPVCRVYADQEVSFFADSYVPSFRFEGADEPTPIVLTLPEPSEQAPTECSLFYGAREVCYGEREVCYEGEGYRVRAFLAAAHHLLLIEVQTDHPASIRLGLRSADRSTEEGDFWHREHKVDFCSRIIEEGRTLFLLGSFDRASDRRYYLVREEMRKRLCAQMPLREGASASDVLTWQDRAPYPAPLLVHTALASSAPECFPLLLFFREEDAYDALVRLFSTDDRISQVAACLLWAQFTEDRDALRRKIVHPTASGAVEESIYLSAARALDALCEEENDSPLLPRLVEAFAELAHDMGDFSGEESYRRRTFSPKPSSSALPETLEAIAARLLDGDPIGVAAWKRRIDTLALFPSPTEASTLWSLFWYGILGYRETPNGFSLSPLLCEGFEGTAFRLRRKGTLYRVRIAISDRPSCLLDGKNAEMPFLFDKNDHFLEITVEKSSRMV